MNVAGASRHCSSDFCFDGSTGALGGIAKWHKIRAESDEAYIWRGLLTGIDIRTISDVQFIARAIGHAASGLSFTALSLKILAFDMKGIVLKQLGTTKYQLEAIFVPDFTDLMSPFSDSATTIGNKLVSELQIRWTSASVANAEFLVINDDDPKHPALDFWISHSTIWDPRLAQGKGGPTAAFARFEGLYMGSAKQGWNLKPWPRKGLPGLRPPPPGVEKASTGVWILIIAVVGMAGYAVYRRQPARKGAA